MSRHGSIFYDAPEALSVLLLNEDKDEIEKMVQNSKEFFLFIIFLILSPIPNHQAVVMMKAMQVIYPVNQLFHHK